MFNAMSYCVYCGSETTHLMSRETACLKEPMITSRIREIVPEIKVGRCTSCNSITASDERIEKFDDILAAYSKTTIDYWPKEISKAQRKLYSDIEKILNPTLSSMSICDVGCGKGDFLKNLNSCWRKIGIEPSLVSNKLIDNKDIQLFNGTLNSVDLPSGTTDVVSYLDVFEHLKDPVGEIKDAFRILKKGGEIVIYVGNSESFFARASGKYWYYLKMFGHISIPSKKALAAILADNGFNDIEVISRTHPSSRSFFEWLVYLLLANLFQRGSVPLYRDHILVRATKKM